ncbi:MAG TPA: undecaprenyl-diphosphate phosphatase, partial [Myxococcota bacterium]|nr:undecaprenyl-diphosphate phosphatase [Myxococcota bacterium]
MPLWISIILLGLIEGITEFLPISSTGHLLLAQHWLPRQSDLFNTVIQAGAVLAVLVLFADRVKGLIVNWREPKSRDYIAKLIVAFGITGAGGIALKKLHFKLPEEPTPVAWATLVGGVLFILVEWVLRRKRADDQVDWPVAVAMGV